MAQFKKKNNHFASNPTTTGFHPLSGIPSPFDTGFMPLSQMTLLGANQVVQKKEKQETIETEEKKNTTPVVQKKDKKVLDNVSEMGNVDMSDTRIHYNSSEPERYNAEAITEVSPIENNPIRLIDSDGMKPNDDYFDEDTGEYLGSDGRGNGIRLTTKTRWNLINNASGDGKFAKPELARQSNISAKLDEQYVSENKISDDLASGIATHYYQEAGYSLNDLNEQKIQNFDNDDTGLAITTLDSKTGKLNIKVDKKDIGKVLNNRDDFINTMEHERGSHGSDLLSRKKLTKQNTIHHWEQRATVFQIGKPSFKGTSLAFKQNLYNTYGKKYLNSATQKKFFGNHGVKLSEHWLKNNYTGQ